MVQLIRICPQSSFGWQGKMEDSQKSRKSITALLSGDSQGLGCQCRAREGDFRTLSPGRARRAQGRAHPEPIRILEGGASRQDRATIGGSARVTVTTGSRPRPPRLRPSRALWPLGSLALARVAPPRRVRASVGPERGCGETGCRQAGRAARGRRRCRGRSIGARRLAERHGPHWP